MTLLFVVLGFLSGVSVGLEVDIDLTHPHDRVEPQFVSVTIDSGILSPPKWRTFSFR